MKNISGVIITHNEEKNIEECIKSLLGLVDEIIIVDSFSTDSTIEIAKKFECVKIYQHNFDGFVNQKNRAIEYSKNDFVLSLDADERLSDKLKNEILNINKINEFDCFYLKRITYIKDKKIKHSGWYPDRKIRLWNKKYGKWEGKNVHEQVVMHNDKSNKIYLKYDIIHYSYSSLEQFINKTISYSKLKAKDKIEKDKKFNIFTLLFKPFIKFIIVYFIKFGILDGFYGFVISTFTAFSDFYIQIFLHDKKTNEHLPS